MGIKSFITDIKSGLKACVCDDDGKEKNALVVASRPLKTYDARTVPFTNPTYGSDMNINAAPSGAPECIHNGLDDICWTASAIIGTWDFNSNTQANSGSFSIDGTGTNDTDIAQFAKGSDFNLEGYGSLGGYIYITSWASPTTNRELQFYGWDTGTSSMVGNSVDLSNYVNVTNLNTWQKFTIPIADMGMTAQIIDAIRLYVVNTGGVAANFYLDDMRFESADVVPPQTYEITARRNTWYHVSYISFTIVTDLYNPTHTIAGSTEEISMAKIPYYGFLGTTLINGIRYLRTSGGEVRFVTIYNNLGEILSQPPSEIKYGYDGTYMWIIVEVHFPEPFILKSEEDDSISLTISDDLSGFSEFSTLTVGKEEMRNYGY